MGGEHSGNGGPEAGAEDTNFIDDDDETEDSKRVVREYQDEGDVEYGSEAKGGKVRQKARRDVRRGKIRQREPQVQGHLRYRSSETMNLLPRIGDWSPDRAPCRRATHSVTGPRLTSTEHSHGNLMGALDKTRPLHTRMRRCYNAAIHLQRRARNQLPIRVIQGSPDFRLGYN